MQFSVDGMLEIVKCNIADKKRLEEEKIDAIVNAANPTLMGSDQGVDGALHKVIENFNEIICNDLQTPLDEKIIRCPRGESRLTTGGELCKYVIHVVGPRYDGTGRFNSDCSSSRINMLESCYTQIIKQLRAHLDISKIMIPVISAGDYGFPYKTAVEVAIVSICNAIIEWKNEDLESFEMSELRKIYLCIYHVTPDKQEECYKIAQKVFEKYRPYLRKNKRTVFQLSLRAHLRNWKEIRE